MEGITETKIGSPTLIKLGDINPLEKQEINIHSPNGDIPAFVFAGEEGTLAIEIGEESFEIKPKSLVDFDKPQIITAHTVAETVSFRVEWLKDNPQGAALFFLPIKNSQESVAA